MFITPLRDVRASIRRSIMAATTHDACHESNEWPLQFGAIEPVAVWRVPPRAHGLHVARKACSNEAIRADRPACCSCEPTTASGTRSALQAAMPHTMCTDPAKQFGKPLALIFESLQQAEPPSRGLLHIVDN